MKNENLSSRIVWADVVRLLAIFMVICAHCADPFNVSPQARLNPDFNFWGTIYGSLLRPCVPLFVMLTGLLILPVRMMTGAFYKKRLTRILWPFLIASVAYNLFPALTGAAGLGYTLIDWLQVPVVLRIPVTAVLVLFTAWGIVTAVYRKAPRLARLIFG